MFLFLFFFYSDVFHWECLSARESSLPANTALGGRVCPTCQKQIFPPENLISPVADVLRNRLGQVNWGRNELGLPLVKKLYFSFYSILYSISFCTLILVF